MISPVVAELRASISDFQGKMMTAKAEMDGLASHGSSVSSKLASFGKGLALGLGGAAVALGGTSIKMAADFQSSMTQLVTGAGESKAALGQVSAGILDMAGKVGQTPAQLAQGMYLIESAGYHGAAGLKVLNAAAQGAAVGGAQMSDVANALTSALHDYHMPAQDANQVTSALITTVAQGKTHLQDLASSMGMVLPVASAVGVSLPQVEGAMATMTVSGMNARRASMELSNAIRSLAAPSTTAQKSMKDVGLTAQQLKDTMSSQGLTGALQLIEQHIGNTFPANSVQAVTAMKNLMGGATGYNVALMLGGQNMATYEQNVKKIGASLHGSGKSVKGFSDVQKDLSFQLDQVKATAEAEAIKIGNVLIPIVEKLSLDVEHATVWLSKHKDVLYALGAVTIPLVAAALGAFTINKIGDFVNSLKSAFNTLDSFASKILNIGTASQTAAGEVAGQAAAMEGDLQGVATQADETSAQMKTVATGSAGAVGGATTAEAGALTVDGTTAAAEIKAAEIAGGSEAATAIGGAEKAGGVTAGADIAGAEATGGVTAGAEEATAVAGSAGILGSSFATIAAPLLAVAIADHFKPQLQSLDDKVVHALGGGSASVIPPAMIGPGKEYQQSQGFFKNFINMFTGGGGGKQQETYIQALTAKVAKDSTLTSKFDTLGAAQQSQNATLSQLKVEQSKLAQDGSIKSTEAQLKELKSTLASEKTVGASKTAVDQTKQAIKDAQQHIDQLKQVSTQITKVQTVQDQTSQLKAKLESVVNAQKTVSNDLHNGVKITKLPQVKFSATGAVKLNVG